MYKEKTSVWWKNMLANKDNYFLEDLKKIYFMDMSVLPACKCCRNQRVYVLDPQEL